MGVVYFAQRGDEGVFKIGRTKNLGLRTKTHATSDPWLRVSHQIETEDDPACEKFIHKFYGSRRIDKEFFSFSPEEIPEVVQTAQEYLAHNVQALKSIEDLCSSASDGRVVTAGDREREIHRQLRLLREEEFRLKVRRELLECELKAIIGTADGVLEIASWKAQIRRLFDGKRFQCEHPQLFEEYSYKKLIRMFRLL